MKAVLYARFSPRRKSAGGECDSNYTQLQACRDYCKEKGIEVRAHFFDERLSGDDIDRPGLWQAVEALKRRDVLIVYRLDRLARDVYLSEYIRRAVKAKGASIRATSGDVEGNGPEQIMIRQVLAAVAEYEKKIIGIRTKYAMLKHQKDGRRMSSRCPYGWKQDPNDPKMMIVNLQEQEHVDFALELHEEGLGARAIARTLDQQGFRPRTNRLWNHKTILSIIKRG